MQLNKNKIVPLAILAWLGISLFLFFRIPMNAGLLKAVYPSFFKALFNLQLKTPDSFWVDLFCELASLALHGAVGVLFLRLFVRLPKLIEAVAGIFVGIGLATFVLELWAIPFLLNRWTVLGSLLALAFLFVALKKKYKWADPIDPVPVEAESHPVDKWLYWTAFGVLSAITALSFYYALLFPVDYWDALILYIHYGKMTYQQGGFPILVCLQVGLGLGANYPHLYPLHQAATAMMVGHWSDLYGQLLPPLAGLSSILVVYFLSLRLFKKRLIAIFAALAFRSVPYVSTYFVWASDYSLVMCYTALFLLFLELFLTRPTLRGLIPLMAVSAIFPHINYMGWIVWPPLALAILWKYRALANGANRAWFQIGAWLLVWFGLGLTWYVRNTIVTGNPVYAFFPKIFGGKNINLDVLASCNQEWTAHGMGAARFGDSLFQKIVNSLLFFQVDWRFAPLLTGIMLPGFLLGWKKKQPFFLIAASLFALYFVYQYIISGLYWYHTIAVFPILALFVGRFLSQIECRKTLTGFCVLLLIASLVPGLSVSMMGPKIPDSSIPLFAHPGLSPDEYYYYAYHCGAGDFKAAPAWRYINKNLEEGAVILSHDNRYHVYRDDIRIIHLDDCDLTPFYGRDYPENHKELWRRGVRYYFYLPDERSHPITAQLGHLKYLNDSKYFKMLFETGKTDSDARLYRLVEPSQ